MYSLSLSLSLIAILQCMRLMGRVVPIEITHSREIDMVGG